MEKMIKVSLIINILVLIPVCLGILTGQERIQDSLGIAQPSLFILVSIYTTILLGSIYLFFRPNLHFIFSLLSMQICYKFLTPIMLGTLNNPVIISNIVIAIIHSVSIYLIIKSSKLKKT
jgi:hypothetical protein